MNEIWQRCHKGENIMKRILSFILGFGIILSISVMTTVYAEAGASIYSEDFSTHTLADFTDYESIEIADGVASSLAQYSRLTFPLSNPIPSDWTFEMDITYSSTELIPVDAGGYVGVNVFDAVSGVTYEFTIEYATNGTAYAFVKGEGGNVVEHSGNSGRNPIVLIDQAFTLKVAKFGERIKFYVDNTEFLSLTNPSFGTPSGFSAYTYSQRQIIFDNVNVYESYAMPADDFIFGFDFNEMNENDLWVSGENAFVVSTDKWAESATTLSQGFPTVDPELFVNNWVISYDIIFPTDVEGYFGFNLSGINGNTYEITIQKTLTGTDYALIKQNGSEYAHSNGTGGIANPVMRADLPNFIRIEKSNDDIDFYINGVKVIHTTIPSSTAPTNIDFYSYGCVTAKFDNFVYRMNEFDLPLQTVTLNVSKLSFSTLQSTTFSTVLNPSSANYTTIEWYVDDVLVVDETSRNMDFSSDNVGTYDVKAVIDGIESNTVTVTVTTPSDIELNSIFYENFDALTNGSDFGNFVVQDGHINTNNQVYGNYFFNVAFVQNWEMSYDVTFHGDVTDNTYVGINIQGLVIPASREFEFNLMRAVGEDEDKVIVKDSGVETLYNDSETYGRLTSLTIEPDVTYSFKIVRWADQLEIWIDDELAIKTYYQNETVATRLFIYWYNASGADVDIDNLVYRESEEITDLVLPPHIDVESAYISANKLTVDSGDSVILSAIAEPSNATPISYQWYVNDTLIAGATESTYTYVTDQAGTFVFKCVIDSVDSDTKTITVNQTVVEPEPETGLTSTQIVIISVGSVAASGGLFAAYWFWLRKVLAAKRV